MLPSEFKSKWENFVKDMIPNVFVNFLENPFILMNLVQDFYLIIYAKAAANIKEVNKSVM